MLQIELRQAAAPIMKNIYTATVAAGGVALPAQPADIIAPIQIWEKPSGQPVTAFQLMTEADPLPNVLPIATLTWWGWVEEVVTFIGSTNSVDIRMTYWRQIPIPTTNAQLVGFIDAELYLAPMTASIAYGSTGDAASMQSLAAIATASLGKVILANRGRAPQAAVSSNKP
jgi:hypothetical protein